jgi:hypothetical protein
MLDNRTEAVGSSAQEFFKATDLLLPSGLLGTVQILPADLIESPIPPSKNSN